MANKNDKVNIAVLANDIAYIKAQMEHLVTRQEFEPVRNLIYGLVGVVLTSVLVAVLTLILRK